MSGIRLEDVTKRYPNGVRAVDDVSLDIADGEFMVLVGPSGCGKTTLLRSIAGLEDVTAGSIWIGDTDVTEKTPQQRDIAMVFQNYALYPHMSRGRQPRLRAEAAADGQGRARPPRCATSPASWAWTSCSTASPRRCRAASASAWRWAGRSCASRRRS